MGKFFAVFMAALVAVSVAQDMSEQGFRDAQCRREVQENPLYACRQVVDRQLTGRASVAGAAPLQWGAMARCCQQLQGVSRECRCAAIRRMVRNYEQTMPPLEEGYGGGWPEERPEQGYYGETTEQQGYRYYGEAAGRQRQGSGVYYGETTRRQQGQQLGEEAYYGEGGESRAQPQQVTRVRLTKVRLYVARLPNLCEMEPMECSVFPYDQYQASCEFCQGV